MIYYLTVAKNREVIVSRLPFDDYSAAIEFISRYYHPRVPGSRATLTFATEIINGLFARSFGSLTACADVEDNATDEEYDEAAKQDVAFVYDGSYRFLIETDVGIRDRERMLRAEDEDE